MKMAVRRPLRGEKVSGKLAEDIRAGRVRKMEVAVD